MYYYFNVWKKKLISELTINKGVRGNNVFACGNFSVFKKMS